MKHHATPFDLFLDACRREIEFTRDFEKIVFLEIYFTTNLNLHFINNLSQNVLPLVAVCILLYHKLHKKKSPSFNDGL